MSTEIIRIGFMPLVDAAIPIIASKKGFAQHEGLEIALFRETSWANIRDRLAIGHFEAAHLLAPMPVATALGLTPFNVPLIAPMALGSGGNAITVSRALWLEMREAHALSGDAASCGAALLRAINHRRDRGLPRLSFAVVHAFSAHNYELRYWLAACGIQPDIDVEIGIVSPPFMPAALASGAIDGFCVGEPWNSIAAATSGAATLLTKAQIWRASPEKVLSVRADWAIAHSGTLTRLLAAMLDAARWCAEPGNAPELMQILAGEDALDVSIVQLRPALETGLLLADGNRAGRREGPVFFEDMATFPWVSHSRWFAHQMLRWGQATPDEDAVERAARTYQPELYRRAALQRGMNVPAVDEKADAGGLARLHLAGTLGPVNVPASSMFDA